MIQEYALDPALLNSWERVRYYCEQFGFEKGRMISLFPKEWKKMVRMGTPNIGERERKRIEELLLRMDGKFHPRAERPYDANESWPTNAINDHQREPFAAIITDEPAAGCDRAIGDEDFNDSHPLMNVPRHPRVPRTPNDVANFLKPMLETAKWILLIDPYFEPTPKMVDRDPKLRPTPWTSTLAALLRYLKVNCRVEYHTKLRGLENEDSWKESCCDQLPHVLPAGARLAVFQWQERPSGRQFHARYAVTDRYAFLCDPGFDAGAYTGNEFAEFAYLGEMDRQELENRYAATSNAYKLLSRHDVVGTGACLPNTRGLQ